MGTNNTILREFETATGRGAIMKLHAKKSLKDFRNELGLALTNYATHINAVLTLKFDKAMQENIELRHELGAIKAHFGEENYAVFRRMLERQP